MKRCVLVMTATLIAISSLATGLSAQSVWNETPEQKAERMSWWTEARFGMFIHWGLYALPARHEWVKNLERISDEDYQKYFDHFNPDLYNPREWARMAKLAGMRYFVITAKHHEGFCLWDSEFTDYKATNTPCDSDLLREMVDAFRAEGIRVGIYYSLIDWHHPSFTVDRRHSMRDNKEFREREKGRDMAVYREYLVNQVRELLTEFKPEVLFLDFSYPGEDGKGRDDWNSLELLRMIRKIQPNIIINDRADLNDVPGGWDFRTPEQFMPRGWVTVDGERVPWETCQTFSGSWGYHRDEATWKSVRQLIVMLIETVSKGGNLLLNVGPTARGTFDGRAVERLEGIGEWMKVNSRSVYGCTAAPEEFPAQDQCILTYNPDTNRLYVHILEWPMGRMHLDGLAGKVEYAQLLHDGSEVLITERPDWQSRVEKVSGNTLTLNLPVMKPDVEIPVIELFLK